MTNLHANSHVGAFRDVSICLAGFLFETKGRHYCLMQLTDDFKQTHDGGSNNAHRSFDTGRSRYRQMGSHTGAFAISNNYIYIMHTCIFMSTKIIQNKYTHHMSFVNPLSPSAVDSSSLQHFESASLGCKGNKFPRHKGIIFLTEDILS